MTETVKKGFFIPTWLIAIVALALIAGAAMQVGMNSNPIASTTSTQSAAESIALKADLKVGPSQENTELSWLERAKMNSKSDATKENPFVVSDGKLLLLYFGDSVSEKPIYEWKFDLDGDDGVFSLPLLGGAEPWLWARAEYDYYANRVGTIKNADGSITVPLVLRIEDGTKLSEDRIYLKILPSK